MFTKIIFLFFTVLLGFYFFTNIDNPFYYYQIKVTIFSLISAIIIYLSYQHIKKINILINKNISNVNYWIDKYGIYLLLGGFFIIINYVTFSKHINFYSSGFDLGIFDQVIYKYSNLEFPASSSIREISNIEADHFHPILGFYAFFYKIYASPLTLLFLQNFFFVLGGLGIYKISKFKLNIPIIGFMLVFLYLIFKGNINALLFDFHPLVPAISLLPWLFYFSIKKKWLYYFILIIPILLTKENLSIYIVFFGIYQFFIQKERYIGIASFLIGGLYFYLVMNYFLPAMGGGGGRYWSYDSLGENPKELIINTLLQPLTFLSIVFSSITKVITYLHHLGSGLYIAIFSPIIIFLIPAYSQKFLSSREEFWGMQFHYSIDIYWVIAIGIIFTFAWIKNKYNKKYVNILILLSIFVFINSSIINLYKSPLFNKYILENKETLVDIIKLLPENVKLSTQNKIVPHFSQNKNIYIFPNLGNAEYILLNTKINSGWPMSKEQNIYYYIKKLKNKENFENIKLPFIKGNLNFTYKYELLIEKEGVYLFKIIKSN